MEIVLSKSLLVYPRADHLKPGFETYVNLTNSGALVTFGKKSPPENEAHGVSVAKARHIYTVKLLLKGEKHRFARNLE